MLRHKWEKMQNAFIVNECSALQYIYEWQASLAVSRFPAQSIKQKIGCNRTVIEHETSLYPVINQLFAAMIAPRSIDEYETKFKEEIVFPILFARNALIRWPNKDEFLRIQRKLSVFPQSCAFKNIVENGGTVIYEEDERDYFLVLETQSNKNAKISKIFAAIDYGFEFGECIIRSLKVHKKKYQLKYGSLLLSAAIHHAKQNHISRFKLTTTLEGIPLYASFGFIPEDSDRSTATMWRSYSKERKMEYIKLRENKLLYLNIDEEPSYQNCWENALNYLHNS